MSEIRRPKKDFSELRRKAAKRVPPLPDMQEIARLSLDEIATIIHELQVHQAELEVQNEELRTAQLALELSRDEYVELYDFSPVGYLTFDRQGIILGLNLHAGQMVGWERGTLLNKPFSVLISPTGHSQKTFFTHLRRAFETKTRQVCELELNVRGSGKIQVRLESVLHAAELEAEEEVCFSAVSDISAAHRVKQGVLATQQHILASMEEGVCVCDELGVISFTNAAFDKLFHSYNGRLLGQRILSLPVRSSAGDAAILQHMFGHLITHPTWKSRVRYRKPDGSVVDAIVRATAMDLFDKKTIIMVWEDVSDLRQAQGALRESEHLFRTIIESTTDAVLLKDRHRRYTYVNPAMAELHGKKAEDLIGKTYAALFGQDDSTYIQDADERVLAGETVEEERALEISGVQVWFHQLRIPLRDSDGNVTGICVIARDITERKMRETGPPHTFGTAVSKAMRPTLALADHAARTDSLVLLMGESGSGKDYLARYIHDRSKRSGGPYMSLNCAAISATLAESELFGHERGAFTGAQSRKRGLLELAEGGTLLLNEIGELPIPLQAKLLTFLDTRRFTRVGGEQETTVNARLIAATNRDLGAEVKARRFRQDLYYRLNVMAIEIPPLRDRLEELPYLVDHILSQLAAEMHPSEHPRISPAVMRELARYHWPGNIRELRNVLERMLIVGDQLHFPETGVAPEPDTNGHSITLHFNAGRTLFDLTDELTNAMCLEALKRSHGNKKEAAQILGISRDSFYRRLKKLGLDTEPDIP